MVESNDFQLLGLLWLKQFNVRPVVHTHKLAISVNQKQFIVVIIEKPQYVLVGCMCASLLIIYQKDKSEV